MNSFGSSSRRMSSERLPNSTPKTMPTIRVRCRLPIPPVNRRLNSSSAKSTIRTVCARNAATGGSALSPATPNRKTMQVCTRTNSASIPMMEGVRTRLSVTVWNRTVATAHANATTNMVRTTVERRSTT